MYITELKPVPPAKRDSMMEGTVNNRQWFPVLHKFESNIRLLRQADARGWPLKVSKDGYLEINDRDFGHGHNTERQ